MMLETGFNKTDFGKGILGACFINDLGTVIALGLLFAPFTYKTIVFLVVTVFCSGRSAVQQSFSKQNICSSHGRHSHEMGDIRSLRIGSAGNLVRQ